MNSLVIVYQIIVFIAYAVCLTTGFWALSLNRKSLVNRLFFLVCLALGLWISSVLISTYSGDYEAAFLWRRIAAVGWGSLYSLLLHFTFLLCAKDRVVGKKAVAGLIYIPAVICLIVFSLVGPVVRREYHLVMGDIGWISLPLSSFWSTFLNLYYISYSLAVLVILFLWGFRDEKVHRGQAFAIMLSYLTAIIMGTVSDILLNRFIEWHIPSLAPLWIMIPMAVLFREINRNRFMSLGEKRGKADLGVILSEKEQVRFYRYISSLFLIISMVFFIYQSFRPGAFTNSLQFSLVLFLTGILLFFLPVLADAEKDRNNIMIVTVNIAIVMMIYYFSFSGLVAIVWPFPVLIMLISILYSKPYLLQSVAAASILGSLGVNILFRDTMPPGTFLSLIPRIVFYFFSAGTATYVQKIYLRRLYENEKQIMFQLMISDISSKLVSVNTGNRDDRFHAILEDLGRYYGADSTYLVIFSRNSRSVSKIVEWGTTMGDQARDYPPMDQSWFYGAVMKNGIVNIPDLSDTAHPPEWARAFFSPALKSLIAIPVFGEGALLGIMGMNFTRIAPLGTDGDTERMLRIPSHLIADALLKVTSEEKINYLAYYDSLTNLPNRTLFFDRLKKDLALSERTEKITAVVMLDLDSFKNINDTMGHEAGDLLLRQVADILSHRIREYDTMARFGGDEFLFILSQLNSVDEATLVAENLLEALSQPIIIAEEEFYITGSLGISCFPRDGEGIDKLIKNADLAMYEAKKQGKNRFCHYTTEMKEGVSEKLRLSNELYRALERGEFLLHYQPQVELEGTKIIGIEALIRWNHPDRGIIPPAVFIPLAEDIGLINDIGKWVLKTACAHNKSLQNEGYSPIKVSVNLSIKQFSDPSLAAQIQDILKDTGLDPGFLELEITESIAMGDIQNVEKTLKELSNLGVIISIDDFGTEYSSLSRLKRLPIDRIKIDQQFIQGISLNENDESITGFIVALSKSMGLKVIAEGVENDDQLSFLTEKACDEIQGFYFYKPMPFHELEEILTN